MESAITLSDSESSDGSSDFDIANDVAMEVEVITSGEDGNPEGTETNEGSATGCTRGKKVTCLLCNEWSMTVPDILKHMNTFHLFDLTALQKKYSMDQESYIKMVNWFRYMNFSPTNLNPRNKIMQQLALDRVLLSKDNCPAPWTDEKWYTQVSDPEDPMLTYWFTSDDSDGERDDVETTEIDKSGTENTTSKAKEILQLQLALALATEEKRIMQKTLARVMSDDTQQPNEVSKNTSGSSNGQEKDYFESYDDLDIHADMLKDNPRTLSYQRAILENKLDFKNKTVLDLGCGTGILSMFCADAGAKLVFAVDKSSMIYEAMDICFENDMESKIQFISEKLETVDNTEMEQVDILVSEFMGYFLLFEGMTNTFLYARDRFLKPGGKMFPSSAHMYVVAISDEETYQNDVQIWDYMHGYKMTTLRKKVLEDASIQVVGKSSVVSNEVVLKELDLHTCNESDLIINGSYEFTITKDCSLTALCGYFSVGFDDGTSHKETLRTSPSAPSTHWKQSIFYLPKKVEVTAGEKVPFMFRCRSHPEFARWLKVYIDMGDISVTYDMK